MIEVEFRNVTITISDVETAKDAYTALCQLLGGKGHGVIAEYTTDSYVVYDESGNLLTTAGERSTEELFPIIG